MDMKVGFIGFGNMAQAMADGFVRTGAVQADEIYGCARDWEKLCRNTEPKGYHPCRDSAELVEHAELVVVAVKPYQVGEVLTPLKAALRERIVLSVAAGVDFAAYERILASGTHHLSTIPNTPVAVGAGVIICEEQDSLSPQERETVEGLLGRVGVVQRVPSNLVGIANTISGCGPAFASMFIEALADAGVLHGLTRPMAYRLASQMVAGTGLLQRETGIHPGAMKDAVCSPGGLTIAGVAELERKGFRGAVIDAVDAVQRKQK